MSQSRELQLHIAQMEEIRSILNAMKNLAFMEIHKLSRFQAMQGQAVANIENAAMDFLNFYPMPVADDKPTHIGILVGAERGFCGDFNDSLINTIAAETYTGIIAIGSRLGNRLAGNSLIEIIADIEGANVAEEVPTVLNRLIDTISSLQISNCNTHHKANANPTLQLTVVYHDNVSSQITRRQILPLFPQQQQTIRYGNPAVLNLEPDDFFSELTDHYLFAVLHEIFYISLLAENQKRLQHLEGAVKHLDDETVNLRRKSQIYRQEEITEEIEVILLNADNL